MKDLRSEEHFFLWKTDDEVYDESIEAPQQIFLTSRMLNDRRGFSHGLT